MPDTLEIIDLRIAIYMYGPEIKFIDRSMGVIDFSKKNDETKYNNTIS